MGKRIYEFVATAADGKTVRGKVSGAGKADAILRLNDRGLKPIEMRLTEEPADDKAFFDQLASLDTSDPTEPVQLNTYELSEDENAGGSKRGPELKRCPFCSEEI